MTCLVQVLLWTRIINFGFDPNLNWTQMLLCIRSSSGHPKFLYARNTKNFTSGSVKAEDKNSASGQNQVRGSGQIEEGKIIAVWEIATTDSAVKRGKWEFRMLSTRRWKRRKRWNFLSSAEFASSKRTNIWHWKKANDGQSVLSKSYTQ